MLDGAFRHKDNLGNDSVVSAGGVQRFSAGKEIRHAEMPGTNGMNHGLQLWINLPQNMKDSEPTYQQVDPQNIPFDKQNGVEIRTIIGEESPVQINTEVLYQDVLINNRIFKTSVPNNWNTILYVLENNIKYDGNILTPGSAFFIKNVGDLIIETEEKTKKSRFILLSGKPHNEPIRQRGSIVL